jgi:hypothetical protein
MLETLVSNTLSNLIHTILLALAGVLAGYAVAIAHRVFARFGVALDQAKDDQIAYVVRQSVMKAEEMINAQVRAGVLPLAKSADAKFNMALDDLLKKVPGLSTKEAVDQIHAALPQLGLGATAAPAVPLDQAAAQ